MSIKSKLRELICEKLTVYTIVTVGCSQLQPFPTFTRHCSSSIVNLRYV